jgi:hypothetical protein
VVRARRRFAPSHFPTCRFVSTRPTMFWVISE